PGPSPGRRRPPGPARPGAGPPPSGPAGPPPPPARPPPAPARPRTPPPPPGEPGGQLLRGEPPPVPGVPHPPGQLPRPGPGPTHPHLGQPRAVLGMPLGCRPGGSGRGQGAAQGRDGGLHLPGPLGGVPERQPEGEVLGAVGHIAPTHPHDRRGPRPPPPPLPPPPP